MQNNFPFMVRFIIALLFYFQELFELAQRKLLRQLCFYAEHQDVDVYPRLFIVDFLKAQSGILVL